jgi:hypothetical protein
MTGTHEFNEVFFTDVRVPAAQRRRREHDGWRLAKVTLGNERVSLSGEGALWGRGPTANDVIDLVRAHGGTDDPLAASAGRAALLGAETLRLIRLRTLSAKLRGLEPGPEASCPQGVRRRAGQHVMAWPRTARGNARRHACRRRPLRGARRRHEKLRLPLFVRADHRRGNRARCNATSSARKSSAFRGTPEE